MTRTHWLTGQPLAEPAPLAPDNLRDFIGGYTPSTTVAFVSYDTSMSPETRALYQAAMDEWTGPASDTPFKLGPGEEYTAYPVPGFNPTVPDALNALRMAFAKDERLSAEVAHLEKLSAGIQAALAVPPISADAHYEAIQRILDRHAAIMPPPPSREVPNG